MARRRKIRSRVRRTVKPVLRRTPASGTLAVRVEAKQRMSADSGILIGGVHDPAEKAADRMADRVMRMPGGVGVVHRKCDECEAEDEKARRKAETSDEEETVQRSPASPLAASVSSAPASSKAARAIAGLGAGSRLPQSDRAFFEPRFGADLSQVRLHDGPAADKAARSVDARAFTLGSDVVFARNQRQVGNPSADRLMAHELSHIVGDGKAVAGGTLRRATLATKDLAENRQYRKVPKAHKKRVQAALDIIEKLTKVKKCRAFFKDRCAGHGSKELEKAFKESTVYLWKGKVYGASIVRNKASVPRMIGYSTSTYREGEWDIAATLLHEMFHTCMVKEKAAPDEEKLAEMAVEACEIYSPHIDKISRRSARVKQSVKLDGYGFGPKRDASHRLLLGSTDIRPVSWVFDNEGSCNIEFKVPAGARSGHVVITNHGIASNGKWLRVLP